MLETRFTLVLRPDTDDPEEAKDDAIAFIAASKEGWYSTIELASDIEVLERDDEE